MKKKYCAIIVIGFLLLIASLTVQAQGVRFWKFADNPTVYKAYSSPEEFLDDGGDWNAIKTFGEQEEPLVGGVTAGNEYNSTSTAPNSDGYLNSNTINVLKMGRGTFGSVIVMAAGRAGGVTNFYNATTTNVNKRASWMATSSIIIASLPNDLAAGTYVFDVNFSYGLLTDHTGTIGTSTITWR